MQRPPCGAVVLLAYVHHRTLLAAIGVLWTGKHYGKHIRASKVQRAERLAPAAQRRVTHRTDPVAPRASRARSARSPSAENVTTRVVLCRFAQPSAKQRLRIAAPRAPAR